MTVDPFSPFNPINGMPVTIMFGTFNYRETIREWIKHASSSCDHWRIICLDQELVGWLNELGHSSCAVYFYDLFPDIPHHDLADLEPKSRLPIIFALRQKIFHALAKSGYNFIHSDADAFWLQDPRPWLMQHAEFDLLISQGTFGPDSHFTRYHFTLCAGFFFCRANARTQNYFRRVEKTEEPMDQKSMNEVILNDPEAHWQIPRLTIWWSSTGRIGGIWRKIPMPVHRVLIWAQHHVPSWLRCVKKQLLRLHCPGKLCWLRALLRYVFISPEIIRGRFSNGLTVGVIPMHLVSRIGCIPPASPWVLHTNVKRRAKEMRLLQG